MKQFGTALLFAIPGYIAGALLGYAGVTLLSANGFDRTMEAEMTGAFFFGPLAAVTAFIAGLIWSRRKRPTVRPD